MKKIYLAGGCFWGLQKYFDQFDGILETEAGYANGPDKAPTYKEVCNDSGHAETLRINYDEQKITLSRILELYFDVIDPLSVNRQGHDSGIQYRTGIYYLTDEQRETVETSMNQLEARLGRKTAIEVMKLACFYPAEEYHQDYLIKNPNGYCHLSASHFEEAKAFGRGK